MNKQNFNHNKYHNNKLNNTSPIPIRKSFIQKKKEKERINLQRREERLYNNIEFIITTTGCSKMEAYVILQENCNDPVEAINKLKY